jgi:hypothetical protein
VQYKLPAALHFASRSTALLEITTLNQQTSSHLRPFTKILKNKKKKKKKSCPISTFPVSL